MALIQCPECKKSISSEASTCPKCGAPITAEHVAAAIQQRKTMRLGCLAFVVIFLVGGLWAGMKDSKDMPTRSAVEKSLQTSGSMGPTEIADLYGGKAVLSDSKAAWWVKDEVAYAANGVAMELSPKAPISPPSVDYAAVERAIGGEKMPLPPHLGMTPATFIDKVNAALAAAKLQPLAKDTYWSYSARVGKEKTGELRIEEVGGMLTSVSVSVPLEADTDSPRRKAQLGMVMATITSLLPGGAAEWDKASAELFKKGVPTGAYSTGNIVLTSSKDDRSFSVTAKPKK